MRVRLAAILLLVLAAAPLRAQEAAPADVTADPGEEEPVEVARGDIPTTPPVQLAIPGIGTVWRFNDLVFGGDGPPAEQSLAPLHEAGVRTIICLDAEPPDWRPAARAGLRSVHLPMRHGRMPPGEVTGYLRALSWLEGGYYIHAAPGEQRGFAAAALGAMWNERLGPARGEQLLRDIGFPADLAGLWSDMDSDYARMGGGTVYPVPPDFPSTLEPAPARLWMQWIDESFRRVGDSRRAGWDEAPEWPGTTAAFEAGAMAAMLGRLAEVSPSLPDEARDGLRAAGGRARDLQGALLEGSAARDSAWSALQQSCRDCHARFRDR